MLVQPSQGVWKLLNNCPKKNQGEKRRGKVVLFGGIDLLSVKAFGKVHYSYRDLIHPFVKMLYNYWDLIHPFSKVYLY